MASKRSRRNSILKTRYEPGCDDMCVENGEGAGATRNLTGVISRRVSFSHTNQVREFEISNSSVDVAQKPDLDSTMCDLNMSVSFNEEEAMETGRNQTGMEIADMSVYQAISNEIVSNSIEERPEATHLYFGAPDPQQFRHPFGQGKSKVTKSSKRKEHQAPSAQLSFGKFGSAKTPKRSKIANTIVPPMPSDLMLQPKILNEIVVQTSPMITREIGLNCTISNHHKKFSDASMMTSPFLFYPQRSANSIESGKPPAIASRKSPNVTVDELEVDPPAVRKSPNVTVDELEVDRPAGRKSPNVSVDELEVDPSVARISPNVTFDKLEVGPLASRKSPNVTVDNLETGPLEGDKLPTNRTFDCLQNAAEIMITSSPIFSPPMTNRSETDTIPTIENYDYLESNGDGIDEVEKTAMFYESDEESHATSQQTTLETLRTTAVRHSNSTVPQTNLTSQAFDENAFRRISDKTQDILVEETCIFEQTLPGTNTTQSLLETTQKSSRERPLIPKSGTTPGCIKLTDKLYEYANAREPLDIYEKWGFLAKAIEDLSRITEEEWNATLMQSKVREFLGDTYTKAVNVNRNRLNDPHPLYRGAMAMIRRTELKGTN